MAIPVKDINQLSKEKNQNYSQVIYKVSDTESYVCHAEMNGETITVASPVWRIKKIVSTGTSPVITKISYADFDDRFNKIASSYNSYTYLA